jgi:hypothetical protein
MYLLIPFSYDRRMCFSASCFPSFGILYILWRIDPLLGRGLETDNEYSLCYAIGR